MYVRMHVCYINQLIGLVSGGSIIACFNSLLSGLHGRAEEVADIMDKEELFKGSLFCCCW